MNIEKLKCHRNNSVQAWHNWKKEMPMYVEVISNEVAKRQGKFLTVKKWIIIPAESGLKECLVAEFDKIVNYLGKDEPLHIHINHLIPAYHS
jgi:hypothetical protein